MKTDERKFLNKKKTCIYTLTHNALLFALVFNGSGKDKVYRV